MKYIHNLVQQGDITFRRVEKIPAGFKQVEAVAERIIAHSETGHHHVATAPVPFVVFQDPKDNMRTFIKAKSEVNIKHLRSWDTHEELRLLDQGGKKQNIWEIIRQRQETVRGWERVQD